MPTNLNIPNEDVTLNYIIQHTTRDYIDKIDKNDPPTPTEIEIQLIKAIKTQLEILNSDLSKGSKMPAPKSLNHSQIAELMMALIN